MEESRELEYSYKTCRLSPEARDTIGRINDAHSTLGGEQQQFCSILDYAS
jgi:hypothetical protein